MATKMTKEELLTILRAAQANKAQKQIEIAQQKEKELAHVPLQTSAETVKESVQEQSISQTMPIPTSLPLPTPQTIPTPMAENAVRIGNKILHFNKNQQAARMLMREGKAFCLIGAAGSGKTSTTAGIGSELVSRLLNEDNGKFSENVLGIVSFTNRAVKNIYAALQDVPQLQAYCSTIHKFLRFAPEFFETFDEDGNLKKSMRFVPTYTRDNPLTECKLVIIEESSMVNVDLFKKLQDACPNATFIFIGDLNQLDPVMGRAILGFKLNEIPVVELSEIYRQAMDSPIIGFQHNYVLQGRSIGDKTLERISNESNGKLKFIKIQGENKIAPESLAMAFGAYMAQLFDKGLYDPDEDIILIPNNDGFGRNPINKIIAQHISVKNNSPVWEIVCGFETRYFAVGDKVIHDREEWHIVEIKRNPRFTMETRIQPPSVELNRFGITAGAGANNKVSEADMSLDTLLAMTQHSLHENVEDDDTVNQASHILKLRKSVVLANETEDDLVVEIGTRGEIAKLEFGYAITIHKSQGSEWKRVFLAIGKYNKRMLSRELLYTGMTRAREELQVFYSPDSAAGRNDNTVSVAIKRQKIPGKTWQEKAKYFQQHQKDYKDFMESDSEIDSLLEQAENEFDASIAETLNTL